MVRENIIEEVPLQPQAKVLSQEKQKNLDLNTSKENRGDNKKICLRGPLKTETP